MEKKTEKILLIVSSIICAIVLISAGWIFFSPLLYKYETEYIPIPPLKFSKDESAGTLTVVELDININWEDFEVTGNATVPTGPMKLGDVITNCTGTITIRDTATKPERLIGTWTFD